MEVSVPADIMEEAETGGAWTLYELVRGGKLTKGTVTCSHHSQKQINRNEKKTFHLTLLSLGSSPNAANGEYFFFILGPTTEIPVVAGDRLTVLALAFETALGLALLPVSASLQTEGAKLVSGEFSKLALLAKLERVVGVCTVPLDDAGDATAEERCKGDVGGDEGPAAYEVRRCNCA